jgi:hypothetical protein
MMCNVLETYNLSISVYKVNLLYKLLRGNAYSTPENIVQFTSRRVRFQLNSLIS